MLVFLAVAQFIERILTDIVIGAGIVAGIFIAGVAVATILGLVLRALL